MMNNPYQQYREQGILTASPMELIIMLYEGCIKQIKLAKLHMEARSYYEANRAMQKAQDIIAELSNSLDLQYDISHELIDIYDFIMRMLLEINATKEPAALDEVVDLLRELQEAWTVVNKKVRSAITLEDT